MRVGPRGEPKEEGQPMEELEQRITELEEKVEYLFSLVSTPAVLQIPDMDQAEQLVTQELGGMVITRETEEISQVDATGWDAQSPARRAASKKAQTDKAIPLPDNFNPSVVGYNSRDFQNDFPEVDATKVFNSFVSHHRSKGDVSKNWMEKFFSYAAGAVKIEKEHRQSQPKTRETDSMGLPLDRAARIRAKRAELDNHQQQLAYEDERETNQ